eukprot:4574371-Heterocapsa_arctica.AAC.1
MLERVLEVQSLSQAQYCANNYTRSARNLMVIARMPEDLSNTFKNLQQPSKTDKAIYTCMCAPVGPTELTNMQYAVAYCMS